LAITYFTLEQTLKILYNIILTQRTTMKRRILLPAYGRQYNTKSAAVNDWFMGKDFIDAESHRYTSVRDIEVLKANHDGVWLDLTTTIIRVT